MRATTLIYYFMWNKPDHRRVSELLRGVNDPEHNLLLEWKCLYDLQYYEDHGVEIITLYPQHAKWGEPLEYCLKHLKYGRITSNEERYSALQRHGFDPSLVIAQMEKGALEQASLWDIARALLRHIAAQPK